MHTKHQITKVLTVLIATAALGAMGSTSSHIVDAASISPAMAYLGMNGGGVSSHKSLRPKMIDPPPGGGGNPACQGPFTDSVATVDFETVPLGNNNYQLNWSFQLTAQAQTDLGPLVSVSMPAASVNGNNINPPYAPHNGYPSYYDFHAKMSKYQYIGSSRIGTLHSGDIMSFGWSVESDTNGNSAWRDTACQIN